MRLEEALQIAMARDSSRDRRIRVGIGDGDKPCAVHRLPGGMMKLREIAGAGTRHVEILRFHSLKLYWQAGHGESPKWCDGHAQDAFLGALFPLQCRVIRTG